MEHERAILCGADKQQLIKVVVIVRTSSHHTNRQRNLRRIGVHQRSQAGCSVLKLYSQHAFQWQLHNLDGLKLQFVLVNHLHYVTSSIRAFTADSNAFWSAALS